MMPPLVSVACPRCTMVQAVPVASPRGPVPRLRCLACHVPLGAGDEVTRVDGRFEVPAPPIDVRWYAMLDGKAVGPLAREEIGRMHRAGLLHDDALVWHDGFAGWARLADTATFTPLVGGRRPAPRVRRSISGMIDLTDDVDLVEAEPAPRRAAPPPLPRRTARAW